MTRGVYNAKVHPKVQQGKMTEDEVFLEFLRNFGDVNKDGTITQDVNAKPSVLIPNTGME
jgi:hypothetical protein